MTTEELVVSGGQLIVLIAQSAMLAFQAWFLYGTLKATKLSAEAAKKSADVAEKSVDNIERPYLLVDGITPQIAEFMGGSINQPTVPHVIVTLKNYGRSPALLLELRACLELMQPDHNVPFLPVLPLGNIIIIGPQADWARTCHYSSAVGEGIKTQIEREQLHMWLFILIRYEDMLGKEHQTQMRFRYAPRDNRFSMQNNDEYTART